MNKLNVKEINYSYNTYKISQLGSDNMELPEYGVVFADGRCVSCNFGSHFVAYGIGALLLIAEKLPREILLPKVGRGGERTAGELFDLISDSISSDGIISDDSSVDGERLASKLFSPYLTLGLSQELTKDCVPELKELVSDVTFIGAKNEDIKVNTFMKKFAEDWVKVNSKFIWGIRVFSYMIENFDFFHENSKREWDDRMARELNAKLPTLKNFPHKNYSKYGIVYNEAHDIASLFNKADYEKVFEVIETYPKIRSLLGKPSFYATSWVDNFTIGDLDDLITLIPKKRRPISDSFSQLLDSGVDSVRIVDGEVNFVLKVKDIEEISYSKIKDVVYLNFKAPSELVLRNFYPEGALVNNFVVDDYVTFSAA